MVSIRLFYEKDNRMLQGVSLTGSSEKSFFQPVIGFEMTGHADSAADGGDPACAAISSAALAFCEAVTGNSKIDSALESSGRGNLRLKITGFDDVSAVWLSGLGSGLTAALKRVSREYPDSVDIIEEREK